MAPACILQVLCLKQRARLTGPSCAAGGTLHTRIASAASEDDALLILAQGIVDAADRAQANTPSAPWLL